LYAVRDIDPESLDIVKTYPELMRCMGCNTCTKSCPVDLKVMDYISAAIRGDLEEVVERSIDCVMCGMCAARCPAEITPFNIALFVRRIYGMHMVPQSAQFEQRLAAIADGSYDEELSRLKTMPDKEMQARFLELQAKKGSSV
jgi:heterodisulfide reductase subunit C